MRVLFREKITEKKPRTVIFMMKIGWTEREEEEEEKYIKIVNTLWDIKGAYVLVFQYVGPRSSSLPVALFL
jgi:hypothetical protein